MSKLQTIPFDVEGSLGNIVGRFESLIRVCVGQKMDERLAMELGVFVHELNLIRNHLKCGKYQGEEL